MTSTDLIRRLHDHRVWSNRQLIAFAERIEDADLFRTHSIGQGSVWKTLTHLYAAEFVWLGALLGNEKPLAPGDAPGMLPGNQQGTAPARTVAELCARWGSLDARWTAYLDCITAQSLEREIFKRNSRTGVRRRYRCSDVHIHVCTHAQYTSAQLVNMLRHSGLTDLPDVMLITLTSQESDEAELSVDSGGIGFADVSESDFEELVMLRTEAMRESLEHAGRFDAQRVRDRLRQSFSAKDTQFITQDDRRIGFYAFRSSDRGYQLDHLYIRPSFQSQGIGSVVLSQLLQRAENERRFVHVGALRTSTSNRFYQRHGFVKASESEHDVYYVWTPSAGRESTCRIVLTGHIIVPGDDIVAVRSELAKHIQQTREEPGCLRFEVTESDEQPGRFNVEEEFIDRVAFDAHQARTQTSNWGRLTQHAQRHYNIREEHVS